MTQQYVASPSANRSAGRQGPSRFSCIVCRHQQATLFLARCTDLYLFKPFEVDYYQCDGCQLVQQHPLPRDVSRFYDDYPVHEAKTKAYSWFRRRLMSGVYLPPNQWRGDSKVLDFGCGDGWYLAWCKEAGLDVVGFEYSTDHAAILAERLGVEVMSDPVVLCSRHAGSFDVITLHFVVEHLTEPLRTFDALRRLLKLGGIIRYVVPNISSWEFRLFRRRWHSLDAPRHIAFPNSIHARRLAEKSSLTFEGESSTPFPNGFGGSLPTALLGRFNVNAFLLTLPFSLLMTRLFPSGNKAYLLRRSA